MKTVDKARSAIVSGFANGSLGVCMMLHVLYNETRLMGSTWSRKCHSGNTAQVLACSSSEGQEVGVARKLGPQLTLRILQPCTSGLGGRHLPGKQTCASLRTERSHVEISSNCVCHSSLVHGAHLRWKGGRHWLSNCQVSRSCSIGFAARFLPCAFTCTYPLYSASSLQRCLHGM